MAIILSACGGGTTPTPTTQAILTPTAALSAGGDATADTSLTTTPGQTGPTGPESTVGGGQPVPTEGSTGALPTMTTGAGSVVTTPAGTAVATDATGGTDLTATPPVPGGGTTSAQIDPCVLLTQIEVTAALGEEVTQGVGSMDATTGAATCQFFGVGRPTTVVGLTVYQNQQQIDAAGDFLSGDQNQPMTGMGDEAWTTPTGIIVRVGQMYISIGVALGGQSAESTQIARGLAQYVLARYQVMGGPGTPDMSGTVAPTAAAQG